MAPHSFPDPAKPAVEPELSNPPVAEGINTSERRPLRRFFIDLGIVAVVLVVLLFLVDLASLFLTPFIPFSWEKEIIPAESLAVSHDAAGRTREEELRRLAARLVERMDLPAGVDVTVHYHTSPIPNAFATLGGNIVVYQGIFDLVESEDELAMVLAHEIGHVKHRDVVRGMVRALGFLLVLSGVQDSGQPMEALAKAGMAGYSRSQESAADAEAVRALCGLYGHAGGATAFFRTLAIKVEKRDVDGGPKFQLPAIMASHPHTLDRLADVESEAAKHGFDATGELTPLAPAFESGE